MYQYIILFVADWACYKFNVYHCSTAASQKFSDDTSYPFIDVYSSVVIESVIMKFAFMKCKRYEYFTVIKT